MMVLTRYVDDVAETIDVPITRADAIDLANEKMRCGGYEAAGFYFEIAIGLDERCAP
jgi:hypothetical protein